MLAESKDLPLSASAVLRRASVAYARATRTLYGLAPLERTIDETTWRFRFAPADDAAKRERVGVVLVIGGHAIAIAVDRLGPWRIALDDARLKVPAPLQTAYLAGIGVALWDALESLLRVPVDVRGLDDVAHDEPTIGFTIEHRPDGSAFSGAIVAGDDATCDALCDMALRAMRPRPVDADWPLAWAASLGRTRIETHELAALVPGDVVVIDDAGLAPSTSGDGDRLALRCRLEVGAGHRQVGWAAWRDRVLERVAPDEDDLMDTDLFDETSDIEASARPAPDGEVAFDDIAVAVRFELARWRAPLHEVAGLAPGAVIDVAGRIDEPVVTLWIDDRCIGRGSLVAVGDRLGVSLTSIYGKAAQREGRPDESPFSDMDRPALADAKTDG